jgi:predicted RNase H-like nuclease (RuvC/YqgF family)
LRLLAEDNHAKATAAVKDMKTAQEALAKNLAEMKGYEERLKNEVLSEYKAQIRTLEAEKAELQRLLDKTQTECTFMKSQVTKLKDELFDVRQKKEELEQRGGTVVSKINAELDKALAEIERLKEELDEAWGDAANARKALKEA